MAVNPNEDTEFNDILRKHGIIPAREPTPPTPSPPGSPTLDELLADFTPSALEERASDARNDDEEREILRIRELRLAQMRREERRARFGEVIPIGRDEYTRQVTDASKENEEDDESEEGRGTGVVCFLYKDGIPHSDRAFGHIRTLAARHPRTKFVSIVGDKCIANLPDSRIPMLLVYRKGEIRQQLVSWGADRERRIEELELVLILCGGIIPPDRPPPRDTDQSGASASNGRDDEDEDSDDGHGGRQRMRSAATSTNGRAPRNIRQGGRAAGDDSDSDFDL